MKLAPLFLLTAALTAQSFDYDTHQPFDVSCEDLSHRPDAELHGCGFTGPRGGKVNLVYIRPKNVRPPYAGVIFQHGGGQSMTHYLNEALILARAGVVSVIPDAPSRRDPPPSDDDKLGPSELQTEVVITERRMLDWLLQQPGVDPKRIAYVGHSYGGVAGSFLSAVEPRFTAFVLLGAVVPEKDPDRYLPHAHAPMLVQCASLNVSMATSAARNNTTGSSATHAFSARAVTEALSPTASTHGGTGRRVRQRPRRRPTASCPDSTGS